MSITDRQRDELLSFNDGKPFIVTQQDNLDGIFNVLAFVRSIASPKPEYINSVSLVMSFPAAFPVESLRIQLNQCRLFHPNFTDNGRWLGSDLENNETLSEYLIRLMRNIQYKEIYIEHIANRNAMAWYNAHKESGFFPTESINYSTRPRISIHRINENIQSNHVQPIQIGAIHYEK